jgi:hypothetical protein
MESAENRNTFYQALGNVHRTAKGEKYNFVRKFRKSCNSLSQNIPSIELVMRSKIAKEWAERRLSTFEYLFSVTILGNRSFNDFSQYPVFPWVLSDYISPSLDLSIDSV